MADGGGAAVAGENLHVVGEGEQLGADRMDQLFVFAAQICASDAFFKDRIARKKHLFIGFVEANAAGSVARGVQHAEGVVAEGECLRTVGCADGLEARRDGEIGATAQKMLGMAGGMREEGLIGRVHVGRQSIGFGRPCATENVIKVSVREQQQGGAKPVRRNVVGNGFLLLGKEGAAVDDGCFARGVGHNVGVFLNRIDGETLYFEHSGLKV